MAAHLGLWRSLQKNTGPCPHCGMHVQWGALTCPHCGHTLSENDIKGIKAYIKAQKRHGMKLALLIFPALFAVALIAYYFA